MLSLGRGGGQGQLERTAGAGRAEPGGVGGPRRETSLRQMQRNIVRTGTPPYTFLRDFYAGLLVARWPTVLAFFFAAYALVNVTFAGLYLVAGDPIIGSRPGSFEDALSFSVQTLST